MSGGKFDENEPTSSRLQQVYMHHHRSNNQCQNQNSYETTSGQATNAGYDAKNFD